MAASPESGDKWNSADDPGLDSMGPVTTHRLEHATGDLESGEAPEVIKPNEDTSGNKTDSGREKPLKPNKVYIGGLPDHTRQEDLQNCFGKIGAIANIELKVGYGFVEPITYNWQEFESKEAAEESVAKYNEGFFMGNKIRVELSHSRGRTAKRSDDPGACFKCGESGHWARECHRHTAHSRGGPLHDATPADRMHPLRDYPPPPRESFSYRDEPARYPPPRDARVYDYPPLPPPPGRDHRRPLTPPRDSRDFLPMGFHPPRRDYDDYRMRGPPPPPPQRLSRYDRPVMHGPERDYPPRGYLPPSPPPLHDLYDVRRPPLTDDRHPPYPPHGGRPRTPPGPPPRQDDYDRPLRDYGPPPEGRGRPMTPPYVQPSSSADRPRYRRRSLSPPPRYDLRYGGPGRFNGSDGERYSGPPRGGGRPPRDYPHRNGRDEGPTRA
ncbi:hypothetical protein BU15DRAFT_78516 [Melanogaster broomeanus]|nr:hypothetical protein BU15DRAFT_78516 [Melanogaster broomeanus]